MTRLASLSKPLVLAAALICAMPSVSQAQPGEASAQGVATARIAAPVTVLAMADLRFGGIAVSAIQAGTVTIVANTGLARFGGGAKSACNGAALFAITGERGRDYGVTLPLVVEAQSLTSAEPGLLVTNLHSASRNRPGIPMAGRLDADGHDELRVGGTLAIPAGYAPGDYTAQVPIVVFYS